MTPEEKKAKKAAYMREYYRSGKGKEASDRYRRSEKGKAKMKELAQSEAKKIWLRRWKLHHHSARRSAHQRWMPVFL